MLRVENNLGGIYRNTGQKQPPCPRVEHSLYIVKWDRRVSTFYKLPPASGNLSLENCSQRKIGKTLPKAIAFFVFLGLLKQ